MNFYKVMVLEDVIVQFGVNDPMPLKRGELVIFSEDDFYFVPEDAKSQTENDSQFYIGGADNVYFAVEPL